MTKFTQAEKLEAAERELRFRERVYARRVMLKKMTQADADREIALMRAIADDYRFLAKIERASLDLFGGGDGRL